MYQSIQKFPSKIARQNLECWMYSIFRVFHLRQQCFPHNLCFLWKQRYPPLHRHFGTTALTTEANQKPSKQEFARTAKTEVFGAMKSLETSSMEQYFKFLSRAVTAKLSVNESEEFRQFISENNLKLLRSNADDNEYREIAVKLFKLLAAVDYDWHQLSGAEKSAFLSLTSRHQDSFYQCFQSLSLFAQWPDAWHSLSEFMQNRYIQRLREKGRAELSLIGGKLSSLTFSRRYGPLPSYFNQISVKVNRTEDFLDFSYSLFSNLLPDAVYDKWLPQKLESILLALLNVTLQAKQIPEDLLTKLLTAVRVIVQKDPELSAHRHLQRLLGRIFSTCRNLIPSDLRPVVYPASPPSSSSSSEKQSMMERIEKATKQIRSLSDAEIIELLQSIDKHEMSWTETPQLVALASSLRTRLQQSTFQDPHSLRLMKRLFILSGKTGTDWSSIGRDGKQVFEEVVRRMTLLPAADDQLECLRMIAEVKGSWRGLPDSLRKVVLSKIEEIGKFRELPVSPLSVNLQEQIFSVLVSLVQQDEVLEQHSFILLLSIASSIANTSYLLKQELNPALWRQQTIAQTLQLIADFSIKSAQIPPSFLQSLYRVIRGDLTLTPELRDVYSFCHEIFRDNYQLLPEDIKVTLAEESPTSRSGLDCQILSVANSYQLIVVLEGFSESGGTWQKMTTREQLQLRRKLESLMSESKESSDLFILGNLLICLAEVQMPFHFFPLVFQQSSFSTVVSLVEQSKSLQEVKTILFMCERLGLHWSAFPISFQSNLQQLFYQQIHSLFPLADVPQANHTRISSAVGAEAVKNAYRGLIDILEMYDMIQFDWKRSKRVFYAMNAVLAFPFKSSVFPPAAMSELAMIFEAFHGVGVTWQDLFLSLQSRVTMFIRSRNDGSPEFDRLCASVASLQSHHVPSQSDSASTPRTEAVASDAVSEIYREIDLSLNSHEKRVRNIELLPFFLKTLVGSGLSWHQIPPDLKTVLLRSLETHFEDKMLSLEAVEQYISSLAELNVPWSDFPPNVQSLIESTIVEAK